MLIAAVLVDYAVEPKRWPDVIACDWPILYRWSRFAVNRAERVVGAKR